MRFAFMVFKRDSVVSRILDHRSSTLSAENRTNRRPDPSFNYRARWYDPKIGRFTSEDPIGLSGGVNQYVYVGNNPVNATDPSGLYEIDVHYYLTYYLAKQTGCFSDNFARQIAEGNQGTDEDSSISPGAGKDFQNSYYHALNTYSQQGVGSPLLLQNVNNSNPKYFGQYLHYLQDTFSHAGYTNTSTGHAPPSWFADFPFGKWGTHATDKTATDIEKTIRMAKVTLGALNGYAQLKCGCQASAWNQEMEDTIRRFAQVGTENPRIADIEGDTGVPFIGKDPILGSPGSLGRKISILGLNWR